MIKKPTDSTPSEFFEIDCIKRFGEALSLSISGCLEMEARQPKQGWKEIAEGLNAQKIMGIKLARKKAIGRQALLKHAAIIQSKLGPQLPY